jgi:mutator protein MutT
LTSRSPVDVAIALVWDGPRLLITRRLANVHLGGYWELPGGKCAPGEAPAACAAREVREELGLEVAVLRPRPVIEHAYQDRLVRLHPFDCRYQGGDPAAAGCAAWRWVTVAELPAYEFPPANAGLLAALAREDGDSTHHPLRGYPTEAQRGL